MMENNKNSSRGAVRRSTVQAAKGASSKQAGRNPENRNFAGSHKNKIRSTSLKQPLPRFSPNLSNILKHPESQEDVREDNFAYPLHSTAIVSGESDPNDENSEVEIAQPALHDKKRGKTMQKAIPHRKELKPNSSALNRISESIEMKENEMNTGNTEDVETEVSTGNTSDVETEDTESEIDTVNTEYVEGEVNTGNTEELTTGSTHDVETEDTESQIDTGNSENASGLRSKLKTVPSSQFNRAPKQLKNVQSRTGAAKKPRAGKSAIRQRASSTGATKKLSLGKSQASNSTKNKQNHNNTDASAFHNRDSFHGEPSSERSIGSKSYRPEREGMSVRRHESCSSHELTASGSSTPEAGPSFVKIRCLEGTKRLAKDLSVLDTVLDEVQTILSKYKESVESNHSQKAIDCFYTIVEGQIMQTIGTVQELQNLKRKDGMVTTAFNKKRKQLLEVHKELIEKEVKLEHLSKEHAELSQRKSDFQVATKFLSDLKELHVQYSEHRNRNPSEKETYDFSSFPALLVESREFFGAAGQLQNINAKLQQELDKS